MYGKPGIKIYPFFMRFFHYVYSKNLLKFHCRYNLLPALTQLAQLSIEARQLQHNKIVTQQSYRLLQ